MLKAIKVVSKHYSHKIGSKLLSSSGLGNHSGFEGAARTARYSTWNPSPEHVNRLIEQSGDTLLARQRHLVRNNPYAAKIRRTWVANGIGSGIFPISKIENKSLRKEVHQKFLDWTDEADADELTDYFGLQAMVAGSMFDMECFVRFRPRRLSDGLTVPLQLQLLEPEQLPLLLNTKVMPNGNRVRCGIEFNRLGKRVAYHFLREHPGDRFLFDVSFQDTVRIPARNILHCYDPTRPGQIRGYSQLSSTLTRIYGLDLFDDAELARKQSASLNAGFITRKPSEDGDEPEGPLGSSAPDSRGDSFLTWESGGLTVLDENEDVTFSQPADVGGNYEAFKYRNTLEIASGAHVPYSKATGDVRRANFTSQRTEELEFRRVLTQWQHMRMVFQFCRPSWNRWMQDGVLSGAFNIEPSDFSSNRKAFIRVEWMPDAWDWVDPTKDREAVQADYAMGLTSRTRAAKERGVDLDTVNDEIEQERKDEKRRGLAFGIPTKFWDIDPKDRDADPSNDEDATESDNADREEEEDLVGTTR